MLDVKVNLLKNRLYITLGRVRRDKVTEAAKQVAAEVCKLDPGFTCIARIVDIRDIDESDISEIRRIQELLASHGMSKVIRVGVDDGKQLLDDIAKGLNYITGFASTLEEAEASLDAWEAERLRESRKDNPRQ
jgi:hypothetical protein